MVIAMSMVGGCLSSDSDSDSNSTSLPPPSSEEGPFWGSSEFLGLVRFVDLCALNWCSRSCANNCIITNRCGKEAGLAALSAFWVARRRTRRRVVFGGEELRALVARRRWARVGGLKEESRT